MESAGNLSTQVAKSLEVCGLSSQEHDNNQLESPSTLNSSSLPTTQATPAEQNQSTINNDDTETAQHLAKALHSLEVVKSAETPDIIEMEPNSNPVPISNCDTTASDPPPVIEGYQRRPRRPESVLISASAMVMNGETFGDVSKKCNIPISTIRFYMVRKGLLRPAPGLKLDEDSTDESGNDE